MSAHPSPEYPRTYPGFCPICQAATTFLVKGPWLRDQLFCETCENGSVPRERHLAHVLDQLAIHESSPANRGISAKMKREAPGYIGSHYFADKPPGAAVGAYRNENLEKQTFADASFDLVISLDVLEHVFDPAAAHREIWRTLKVGGLHICTFPVSGARFNAVARRAKLEADGSITHLVEKPDYHGNPISNEGALVTVDYGYEIHKQIGEWAPFDVTVVRAANKTIGVLGDYTEVFVCSRRS